MSPADHALIRRLEGILLESYEALSVEEGMQVHQVFSAEGDACEYLLDDYFSRHLVSKIPEIIARVMRFDPILVYTLPAGPVNAYLREAVRCYVHGLHQGAVVLARAAMELGLRERVPYALQNRWTLDELVDASGRFKVLDGAHLQMATDVQHCGNEVLHQKPCSPNNAYEALMKARAVLEQLFGERP
jgi:hypothetical protein